MILCAIMLAQESKAAFRYGMNSDCDYGMNPRHDSDLSGHLS